MAKIFSSRFYTRQLLTAVIVIIIVLGAWGLRSYTNRNDRIPSNNPAATDLKKDSSVSATTPAQTSTPKEPNGVPQGTTTDNHGQAAVSTNSQQWTTSQSGAITLKQPLSGSTFKSGAIIAGSATVSQVQYRLIDNSVGKIAEGTLSVVNGSFSGTVTFQPHASAGQLDVFSTNYPYGPELNEIQIPVNF